MLRCDFIQQRREWLSVSNHACTVSLNRRNHQIEECWYFGRTLHLSFWLLERSVRARPTDPRVFTRNALFNFPNGCEILVDSLSVWTTHDVTAFENLKQHLGFSDAANWKEKAVRRTAPMAGVIYSLTVVRFHNIGHQYVEFPHRPWYPQKKWPSFADMLTTLRR
jgi:hypothetical protein